jgi:dipeptidyl aminopeptidase/acylaminoacyl peptidase
MKKLLLIGFNVLFAYHLAFAQSPFDIDNIMRDPRWIGHSPSEAWWNPTDGNLYFLWNDGTSKTDTPFYWNATTDKVEKANLNTQYFYALKYGQFAENNTILFSINNAWLLKSAQESQVVLESGLNASSVHYDANGVFVDYMSDKVVYRKRLPSMRIEPLLFLKKQEEEKPNPNAQEQWLIAQQKTLFPKTFDKPISTRWSFDTTVYTAKLPLKDYTIEGVKVSPNKAWAWVGLQSAEQGKVADVPNYLTESGFSEMIPTRVKVGNRLAEFKYYVVNLKEKKTIEFDLSQIPGIYDLPHFAKGYPNMAKYWDEKAKKPRSVYIHGPFWNASGSNAAIVVRTLDNKDRWILSLDANGKTSVLHREHNDAWVGGPGIEAYWELSGNIGWVSDERLWFQSEQTGYSHIYIYNTQEQKLIQLTSGNYEVQEAILSKDKSAFYVVCNRTHPGAGTIQKLNITTSQSNDLSSAIGLYELVYSPYTDKLAYRFSTISKPWSLLVADEKGINTQELVKVTSEAYDNLPLKEPRVIRFKAKDQTDVFARLHTPEKSNHKAVIFVHGAGYLQNAHYGWSHYFRENLFHQLLREKGYTVLDIDYRGSSGYGRDFRTGIYRFMGDKDLSDQVDGVQYLLDSMNINPKKVGIYGGSYGGFITLFALFKHPSVFKSGAALRSVTDWAHYNHGYTANILNTPLEDSVAYVQSSPIYYAEGLKGNLLICHGMLDLNVHFQDVVRLNQRLIELKKDNWEMAVYPVEDHGFKKPESWMDEYKRILKLFETTLNE